EWKVEELKENKLSGDLGLVLKSTARHHAISSKLYKPFTFEDKPLIVQDEGGPVKIEDPNAVKPEGWLDDESHLIPDSEAHKPSDWNDDMDGEWEAPLVPNPKCKTASGCGEWSPPLIDNPNYKGKWKPPMIENPNYQDLNPFKMTTFSAVGLELWSMTPDIYFDNFIICSDKEVADRWASDSWGLKKLVASANEPGMINQLLAAADERPWLWGLYLLTAALPVGLLILFCWPRKKIEEEEDADFSMSDFI
ncbi:hypothetical protein AB205_0156670, partial [Aquarana catesbeiana]